MIERWKRQMNSTFQFPHLCERSITMRIVGHLWGSILATLACLGHRIVSFVVFLGIFVNLDVEQRSIRGAIGGTKIFEISILMVPKHDCTIRRSHLFTALSLDHGYSRYPTPPSILILLFVAQEVSSRTLLASHIVGLSSLLATIRTHFLLLTLCQTDVWQDCVFLPGVCACGGCFHISITAYDKNKLYSR